MAIVYHSYPMIYRAAELRFVRSEYGGGTVLYQLMADDEQVASILCAELPPITVVRSSPIEGAK
jgi:hypothetical protein